MHYCIIAIMNIVNILNHYYRKVIIFLYSLKFINYSDDVLKIHDIIGYFNVLYGKELFNKNNINGVYQKYYENRQINKEHNY